MRQFLLSLFQYYNRLLKYRQLAIVMGNKIPHAALNTSTNVLFLQNLHQQLSSCQQIQTKSCSIYGIIHLVEYRSHQFLVQQLSNIQSTSIDSQQGIASNSSLTKKFGQNPPQEYAHFLVNSNIIIIPDYVLLQNYKIQTYNQQISLLNLIKEIAETISIVNIGIGRNKICLPKYDLRQIFSGQLRNRQEYNSRSHIRANLKWKLLGFDYNNPYWNYKALVQHSLRQSDVYLSPELMHAFSKDKIYPKIDIKKSDVFVLAIMAIQILFEEELLTKIYNYNTFQIKLKPILQKLALIQQKFSEFTYRLFVKMLQFEPDQRIMPQQLVRDIGYYLSAKTSLKSPEIIDKQSPNISKIVTPVNSKPKVGSPFLRQYDQRDRQSRNIGRSPGAIRKNFQGNDRSLSPCNTRRKASNPLIKITPGNFIGETNNENSPAIQPFGLFQKTSSRLQGTRRLSKGDVKYPKVQNIRY